MKRLAKPEKEEGGREARDKGKELMKPYARMLAKVRGGKDRAYGLGFSYPVSRD